MSILIKDMEMPQDCSKCPCFQHNMFNDDIDGYCKALKTKIIYSDEHRPSCPLIEIPTPHGRLGDLDKLKAQYVHGKADDEIESAWISNIRRAITNATTVIEAEGREE